MHMDEKHIKKQNQILLLYILPEYCYYTGSQTGQNMNIKMRRGFDECII